MLLMSRLIQLCIDDVSYRLFVFSTLCIINSRMGEMQTAKFPKGIMRVYMLFTYRLLLWYTF